MASEEPRSLIVSMHFRCGTERVWTLKPGDPGKSPRLFKQTRDEEDLVIRAAEGIKARRLQEQVRNEWVAS